MKTDTDNDERSPVFSILPLLQRIVWTSHLRKDYGFTRMQFMIFLALAMRGQLNMTQIADFMGTSKEQATRAVAPMVTAGLVERFVPESNRTYVDIRLTDSGRELLARYCKEAECQIQDRLSMALTPDERQLLRDSLTTATGLLMKIT